jgi:NDP-sugar pyrophosphorylase family protein
MRARTLNHIPLVDGAGRVVGLEVAGRLTARAQRDNLVVLMAGGPGLRLRPLTESVPKPLLPVGDRPIVEIIVEAFVRAGFTRQLLAVGYKAAMLRERLGDGRRLGAVIDYVVEDERLGTAGALGLLPTRPTAPFFVMNADVLTAVDPRHLMAFHEEHAGSATVCVREVDATQPYGVVEIADGRLRSIVEKPVTRHFVNAGIYVLAPHVLDLVERGRPLDMPALLGRLVARGDAPHVFPLHEPWLDIGRPADYERAREGALGTAG